MITEQISQLNLKNLKVKLIILQQIFKFDINIIQDNKKDIVVSKINNKKE